jgi:hypothetical protein
MPPESKEKAKVKVQAEVRRLLKSPLAVLGSTGQSISTAPSI